MNKQCETKTAAAVSSARHQAARAAVDDVRKEQAETAARSAYDKAYNEGLADCLSEAHAKELAQEASDRAYAEVHSTASAATADVAPAAPAAPADLEALQAEWHVFQRRAARRKVHAVASPTSHARAAAADAAADAKVVENEVHRMEAQLAAREIAVPQDLLEVSDETSPERQHALARGIATAVRRLHLMGGKLPAEQRAERLEDELARAKARIAELEA